MDFAVVARYVHQVVGDAVAVDVAVVVEAVTRGTVSAVEQGVVVLAVLIADGGDDAVGYGVAGVVRGGEVGTVDGVEARPGGAGVGAGHAAHLLAHGVGVGGHEAQVLQRLGVEGEVGYPSVALAGVGEHAGGGHVGVVHIVLGIDHAVVGSLQVLPAVGILDVPVLQAHVLEHVGVDDLGGEGEGEGDGELVVDGQRALPLLRHLEVFVDTHDGTGLHTVGRGDGGGSAEKLYHTVYIGDDAAGKLVKARVARGDNAVPIAGGGAHEVLHHTRAGGHVGEEHEGQTAGEETGTAAHGERLVAEDIPVEAQTGRHLDAGVGPLAGIHTATVEVDVVDGIVAHDVVVVVGDIVEADAARNLQIAQGVPLILHIEAILVAVHLGSGILVAEIAVGEGHRLRGCAAEEIVERAVAVVAGTVAHVGVEGHLVLEVETGGEFVGTQVVGEVFVDGKHLVLHSVFPGEELIAEAHVGLEGLGDGAVGRGLVAGHDVDMGEGGRVAAALVADV